MKATMITSFLGAVAALASGAAAVATPKPQSVWVPTITSPTADSVWHLGSNQNVTWDTSSAPTSISNQFRVTLAGKTLAVGFDPRAGFVTVVVDSSITPGTYQLTLFGNSGNRSPPFQVVV